MERPQSWYVYTYSKSDDTVFYVGKGTGDRINHHEREAASNCVCRKCATIREIWASGKPAKKRIVFETLVEQEALAKEEELIRVHAGEHLTNGPNGRILPPERKKTMTTQKQWLLSNADLCNLQMALATEIAEHKQGRIVAHHLRNLEELAAKLRTIQENTARVFDEGRGDDTGEPCEQLLVTLVDLQYSDWWDEDPYTVIPVGGQWGVFLKGAPLIPVGEKTHSQQTHAYRACRRLNAAAREALAPISEQQLSSIRKLCEELSKAEPENLESLKYSEAKTLIQRLTVEIAERHMQASQQS